MEDLSKLLADFQRARQDFEKVSKDLPRVIGIISVKEVRENFRRQSYTGPNGIEQWQPRKASTNAQYDRGRVANSRTGKLSKYRTGKNSTFKGSVYSSSNPIQMQTLALFNSIQYKILGGYVFVGTNLSIVPYARALNEGLGHEQRRQFMSFGNQPINPMIVRNVTQKLDFETKKALGKFKL